MKPGDSWDRLAAAARLARDDRDEAAPYGFAARVAAHAMAAPRAPASIFMSFSLGAAVRALGAAGALALVAAIAGYPSAVRIFSSRGLADPVLSTGAASAPAAPDIPALAAPAPESPAAATSAEDDPVADLVNLAS